MIEWKQYDREYTVRVYEDRTEWRSCLNGLIHREDGPAIEWADGSKQWYYHGQLHRFGGPASEWASGMKVWYEWDLLHRKDGPAIIGADGTKRWFLNGESMTEEEHAERMRRRDPVVESVIEKMLHRSDLGQKKYGLTLDRDDLSREDWLIHLQEELMDATNYIETLLRKDRNDG